MNADEILNRIDAYLDQHLDPKGARGSIYQDPYKSDFFKLCLDAYQRGYFEASFRQRLTGDAMADTFCERWMSLDKEYQQQKLKLLRDMLAMWDEWYYTLEKINYEKTSD